MNLTNEQYDVLKKLNNEYDLPNLDKVLKELDQDKGNICVECPEHKKKVYVHDKNHPVLISGDISGFGAKFSWCQISTINQWTDAVLKVFRGNILYEYANEDFGGRTSDPCCTALDLVKESHVCYCFTKVNSMRELNLIIGENIIDLLTTGTIREWADYATDEDKEFYYNKLNDSKRKKEELKALRRVNNNSFKQFILENGVKHPDIPDLAYAYKVLTGSV